jgi:class 3 adenylate cyclase
VDRACILIVDDEPFNLDVLEQELELLGHASVRAANGEEALEKLKAESFDLALLDVMMPRLDGYGVLERMRSQEAWRHIPVIMISALTDLRSIVRCIACGADDYLPKPFEPVLLKARIGACLERKRLHDREAAHLAEIDRQRRRAEELLDAIFPASAVAELESSQSVTPRRHENVVVMFADVVGFTAFCEAHAPEEIVANLHLFTSAFEDLTARHGLEKIKTVGDAVMATAGLLLPNRDPVMASVECAVATIKSARRLPACWDLRIGIHIGPVVAGVVGRQKFSFDIWGDTVNIAARLAAYGTTPGIHLSTAARQQVRSRVRAVPLGSASIKGKGDMDIYQLTVPSSGKQGAPRCRL